jgi:hypothetical protein
LKINIEIHIGVYHLGLTYGGWVLKLRLKNPPRIWFPLDPIRPPSLLPRPHWRFFSTHISSNAIVLPWQPARRQFRSADVLRVAAHRQWRHSGPLIAIESQPAHLMMASHCSCAAAGACATPRRHARARPSNTLSAAAVGRLPMVLSSMCPMSTWWRRPSTWDAIVVVDRGGRLNFGLWLPTGIRHYARWI